MIVTLRLDPAADYAELRTPRARLLSLVASIAIHVAGISFIAWLSPHLASEPNEVRMTPVRIEIRIPRSVPTPKPSDQSRAAPSQPTAPAPRPPAPGAPPPKLALPQLPPTKARELTILQPNLIQPPTTPVENIRVPSIIVWTSVPVKPKPKQFIVPGARELRPADLRTTAPLSLELPKDLPVVSDLTMRPAPVPDIVKLSVPVAAPRPVRAFQPPPNLPPPPSAPIEMMLGDPTNIVVLSPANAQAVDRLRLPDGSQVAAIHAVRPPEAVSTIGQTPAGTGAKPDSAATAPGAGSPSARDNAASTPVVGGTRAASTGGGLPGGITVTGGPGNGTSAAGLLAGIPGLVLSQSTVPIKVEHPVNGVFDVVVMQSSLLSEFAGLASLSGSPVYTVYLAVGRSKAWVMQFCVPNEHAVAKREGAVVQLSSPAPLKAPYPRLTVAPPGTIGKIVVHGFISDIGQFEGLHTVSGDKAVADTLLLPLLERWLMRPATRDGKPVRVEMMLLTSG